MKLNKARSFPNLNAINVSPYLRALKTGGAEITREKWDEAEARTNPDESMTIEPNDKTIHELVPDWTRSPLPVGAPAVIRSQPAVVPASPQTAVAV